MHKLDNYSSLSEAFYDFANNNPEKIVYQQAQLNPENSQARRNWLSTNYQQSRSRILKIVNYLKVNGVKVGDKVAILSQSRPEWMEADLAILSLGAISISVYQSLPASEVGYILYDSGAKFVFAENSEQAKKILWLSQNEIEIPATEERSACKTKVEIEQLITFENINCPGVIFLNDLLKQHTEFNQADLPKLSRDLEASFVYTSGTTGPPKGVIQTHGNHLSNCRQAWVAGLLHKDASILVFLPLAHSFAKLMGYLGFLTEASLKFPAITDRTSSKMDPESVTKDIRESNAEIIPIVPRLLEKMQSGIIAKSRSGGLGGALVSAVLNSSKAIQLKQANFKDGVLFKLTAGLRKKIKQKLFGEKFKYCISGGAKLNVDTAYFFDMLGIEILEGYGLTETCVATNVNRFGSKKIGTVGPVLDKDIELRIAEDGEILYRGPNIAKGYYGRKQATSNSWDSAGWFHTGDLGSVDNDGYLSIVGRKKDILVSSYGKNIAPEDIEAKVKASQYISQSILVGDARAYCVVLVTLDEGAVRNYLATQKIQGSIELHKDPSVRKLIETEVQIVNKDLPNHEQMRKVLIVPGDFTVENGLLTPTFKVKKKLVLEKYKEDIELLYKE